VGQKQSEAGAENICKAGEGIAQGYCLSRVAFLSRQRFADPAVEQLQDSFSSSPLCALRQVWVPKFESTGSSTAMVLTGDRHPIDY